VDFAGFDTNNDGLLTTDELHLFFVIRGYEEAYGGATSCSDRPRVWAHRTFLGLGAAAPVIDGVVAGSPANAAAKQGGYALMGEWHCSSSDSPGHMATLGVAAHELAHDIGIGAPDLYDTGSLIGTASHGVGNWSLMGAGAWNGKQVSAWPGARPAMPDPFVRSLFGILVPSEINVSGPVILPQIQSAGAPNWGVFQILPNPNGVDWMLNRQSGTGEYFLVENRQRAGDFDIALPGEGVLIWHIYEGASHYNFAANADEGVGPPGNPRLVALEQADGKFDLECYAMPSASQCNSGDSTDPWAAGTAVVFGDSSIPASSRYDGSRSGVNVASISASGPVMSAVFRLPGSEFTSAPPSPELHAVVNAASYRPNPSPDGAIAPGSIAAIFGTELAGSVSSAGTVPLPVTLGETTVLFNGVPAPVFYASRTQVNVQVPFEVPLGTVAVQVERGQVVSAPYVARIAEVSPGIFTTSAQGPELGAILHADTNQLVTPQNPARPGEFIAIYATGLGPLGEAVSTGASAPAVQTRNQPIVSISGVPASVGYSGLAPGLIGVYQINVEVPAVAAGLQPVKVVINGAASNVVSMPIAAE
jgi:uncharacterized protein (TIGR03437 family)